MTSNVEHSPDVPSLATRAFSKTLFGGGQYRVEIGAAIHGKGIVNTSELSEELNLSKQTVNQELRLLERIGLLLRTSDPGASRKVYLMKQDSGYWEFCVEAARMAAGRLRDAQPF
jgi:predicted transcriptional regulator